MSTMPALSVAVFAPVAAIIALVGFFALRANVRALGFWLFGWTAFLTAAGISLSVSESSSIRPVAFLFSSLITPLMVMGAYAHTNRPIPTWVLPVGFLLGVTRLSAFLLGSPELSSWIAGTFEPAFAFFAAETIRRHSERHAGRIAPTDRSLIVGFIFLGITEFFEAGSQLAGLPLTYLWGAWTLVGLPLFSLQMSLHIHRLSSNATRHAREAEAYAHRLKLLTESARDIIVECDDRGTILYVSENVSEIADSPSSDLIGRSVLEFLHTRKDSAIARSVEQDGRITEQAVSKGPPRIDRVVMPDGSKSWFESTGATYQTASGELRILVCTRDVTARVMQEAETKENEQRLNRAERIANLGSWEYLPIEDELIWSDQMFRLHGFSGHSNQIDLARMKSLVHPDDLDELIASFEYDSPTSEIIYRIRRTDNGEIRRLRARGEISRDENGRVIRITGASIDVTEQLELESRLRRGEHHLRILVGSNIVGVFYPKADGTIPEANDAFLSLLDYTSEDLPLVWKEITAADCHSRDELAREELVKTGIVLPYEKDFIARSGERITMLVGCARLDPEEAMVIAVDLSERKRAEAYITQYQKELEKTIAERTHELIQSRGRLIETDRLAAVGTLAAGVAHQINNPIGAILNSAEYALLCRNDENAAKIFEQALSANLSEAQRCAQIVKSMLLFSRDEPTAKWIGDLNSVAQRAHRAITPYASDRGSFVQIRTPSDSIFSQISPIEIEQAIVNILRNAIESRDEGASISLSLTRRDKTAEIEVLDDGRGIDSEHRDHLFEPFYSTRTRDGGTGLGLSVAHGIITDHGGEIQIDSIQGEGTRVLITLPIVDADPH